MKIAVVAFSYLPSIGGSQINLHNVLSLLARRDDFDITLYLPHKTYKKLSALGYMQSMPFRIKKLPMGLGRITQTIPAVGRAIGKSFLEREIAKENYELLHADLTFPAGYIATACKSIPVSICSQGEDIQYHKELGYGLRLNTKWSKAISEGVRDADALSAISPSVADEFISIIGKDDDKIYHTPNGADVPRMLAGDSDKSALRKKLGLDCNRPILLTVGRNHPKKGYNFIPRILEHLVKTHPQVQWHVIGKGCTAIAEYDKSGLCKDHLVLHETIAHANQSSDMPLHERLNELPSRDLIDYYQAADIFVLPSLMEGLPLVLVEAMAAGLGGVTTDAPGCRDVVATAEDGGARQTW